MTTRGPELRARSTGHQAVQVLLAAVAAIVIAVASQGAPPAAPECGDGSVCDGV